MAARRGQWRQPGAVSAIMHATASSSAIIVREWRTVNMEEDADLAPGQEDGDRTHRKKCSSRGRNSRCLVDYHCSTVSLKYSEMVVRCHMSGGDPTAVVDLNLSCMVSQT